MQTGVMRGRKRKKRGEVQDWDDYQIKCCLRRVWGIFLQCTQQLILNLLQWEECACAATGTRLRSHKAFGLSGDWEGEAGDRSACLEKHQAQEIQFLWLFQRRRAALRTQDSAKRRCETNMKRRERNTEGVRCGKQLVQFELVHS